MNNFYNINRDCYDTPQEFFYTTMCQVTDDNAIIFEILGTIFWTNILTKIICLKDELLYYSSGIILSAFSINCICKTTKLKLPIIILEQGTECLKALTKIKIDTTYNMSENQKQVEKE